MKKPRKVTPTCISDTAEAGSSIPPLPDRPDLNECLSYSNFSGAAVRRPSRAGRFYAASAALCDILDTIGAAASFGGSRPLWEEKALPDTERLVAANQLLPSLGGAYDRIAGQA